MTTEDLYTTLELTRLVHHTVTTQPEQFDMNHWAQRQGCRTTLCMAGWAVQLNGALPDWTSRDGWHAGVTTAVYEDGREVDIQAEGARLLGVETCLCEYDCTCEGLAADPFFMDDDKAVAWLAGRIKELEHGLDEVPTKEVVHIDG